LSGSGVAHGTINYFGSFDGCNLKLSTNFIGKQIQEPAPGYENYEGIEGTAHFEFSFDLTNVNCIPD
jgi:hypothetical protein